MEELIRKRGRIKAKLTRICTFGEQCESNATSATDIKIRLDILAEIWTEFDQTQGKIECECPDDELANNQHEQEAFEARFCAVKAKLVCAYDQIATPSPNLTAARSSERSTTHVRLPAIELPVFTGDYKQWASFADMFRSSIDQNLSLSSVQKLHYLKSSVKGEAAKLINSMAITEVNYLEAWKILNDRYSNKRQVVQSHLKALSSQPVLLSENVGDIRKLLDVTVENIRSLNALDLPTDEWDCWVIFMVTERLDSDTRRHWELSLADHAEPTFADLKDFIERHCRALEASGPMRRVTITPAKGKSHLPKNSPVSNSYHVAASVCVKCKAQHQLFRCAEFQQLSIEERIELVRKASLCFNCMKADHIARDCKSSACKKCGLHHNTLLHRRIERRPNGDPDTTIVTTHQFKPQASHTQILLATAVVKICDSSGNLQTARALLDSGSQATFITEDCVQRLGLGKQKTNVTISGLGATGVSVCRGMVQLHITSVHSSYMFDVCALVLQRVTGTIPCQSVDTKRLSSIIHHHQLVLADPDYHKPGSIDLLLGADIYYELLLSGRLKEVDSSTILQNTSLGWIVSGPVASQNSAFVVTSHLAYQDLDQQLKRFWEVEEIGERQLLTAEELQCEEHFKSTHTRTVEGRFIVKLPFRNNTVDICDTSGLARQRLMQMEKRLETKPRHKSEYHGFMMEYLDLDHMEEVKPNLSVMSYYLPHHYVLKEASSTTRLRVVFDGTVSPGGGRSLNHALMVGPTIQEDLMSIVMRFRMHNHVFTADIAKMYRQVLVHPDHRDYQRIMWRQSSSMVVQHFRLKTVTYGSASAPFLATRCLVELANIGESNHPRASEVIKRDFYVDDLISGTDTVEAALEVQSQLISLLSSGGFELRKWASNTIDLVKDLPNELQSCDHAFNLTEDMIKTLGIQWQPTNDQFCFKVNVETSEHTTKRIVLSQISKLFDPLGWLAPVILWAKVLIQRLWLLGLGWDEELPPGIAQEWKHFHGDLKLLDQIIIPRHMVSDSSSSDHQLHGFCDASESAFGAGIFIRSSGESIATVRLVCSKSRVAPLQKVSLPRLELCGAVVLARLMKKVASILNIESDRIFAWTDSTIVLAWLKRPPHMWKTYVANRVAEIQNLLSPEHWHHVSSNDNPADCLSHGLSPASLKDHKLWWSGPSWLTLEESQWPTSSKHDKDHPDEVLEARKPKVEVCVGTMQIFMEVKNYSSLSKLIRISSYCRRFINNCRVSGAGRVTGFLTTGELHSSLLYFIKQAQLENFGHEMQCCVNKKDISPNSKLISLHPFVDGDGLLRVGGRLEHSNMTYSQRHPLILPHNHVLTTLIIAHTHIINLHAGPQLLQTILHRKFWILRCKQLVRQFVHKCIKCFRHRASASQQLMGSFPRSRVEPARAFLRCGVDYTGPLLLKLAKGRGNGRVHKAYVCVFICFTTKAVHIELVNDLSTPSFIASLRRFIARRGKPSDIYSDCGTNFVGADHKLHDLVQLVSSTQHNQRVSGVLTDVGISWHFNPPSAPHFGGLWEAGVKSIKFHLRRIVGTTSLTYEEMYTVLTQIEACLNSRPLCPLSSNPNEFTALTPGHFLIGDALVAAPDQDVTQLQLNRLSRWQLVQRMFQHFWRRWSNEYLTRLQQRPKWMSSRTNIAVGDLVLLWEKELSPLHWPMGRVTQVHPGDDGLVRVVTLRTSAGLFKRPISKICLLPLENSC